MKKIPIELELKGNRLVLHYSSFQGVKMEVDVTGVWHFFKDYMEYLKEPSKPSDVLYPPSEGISMGTIRVMTEAEIRADERIVLREKFDKVLNEASVCEEIEVMHSVFKDFIQELK